MADVGDRQEGRKGGFFRTVRGGGSVRLVSLPSPSAADCQLPPPPPAFGTV
jgi:hypothetical protein